MRQVRCITLIEVSTDDGGFELSAAHEQCLRDQVISDEPGTLLHDFDTILDFVGPDGVATQGKHNLLPMKSIGELDGRLAGRSDLELKRPQIRSHPYLQGLNLLLRASGPTRIEGTGAKARMVVDPEMMLQWKQLNPTERYFNLFEAWLRFGRAEMVGERSGIWQAPAQVLDGLAELPSDGFTVRPQEASVHLRRTASAGNSISWP